jgi:hypothetical protein
VVCVNTMAQNSILNIHFEIQYSSLLWVPKNRVVTRVETRVETRVILVIVILIEVWVIPEVLVVPVGVL